MSSGHDKRNSRRLNCCAARIYHPRPYSGTRQTPASPPTAAGMARKPPGDHVKLFDKPGVIAALVLAAAGA
ncbi:MAG: hypothetical protein AMXMBFR66_11280 [Pseudomonadota bacterium]